MFTALDIANHFLGFTNEAQEETLTHLKLQKLLYYAQGFHLAGQKRPLFDEQIEAWEHGPVVRSVYDRFKDYKANPLPKAAPHPAPLPQYVRDLLESVYIEYGQYDAWRLREMTHEERPWQEAIRKGKNTPLNPETMQIHFRGVMNGYLGLTEDDLEIVPAPCPSY